MRYPPWRRQFQVSIQSERRGQSECGFRGSATCRPAARQCSRGVRSKEGAVASCGSISTIQAHTFSRRGFGAGSNAYESDRIDDQAYTLAGCFVAMFWATTHAADAIAQEMKNAVHGNRVLGAARIAGPQTSSVNKLIIPASAHAATRGKIENSTPRPLAICPAPVRYAQPTRYGSHAGTKSAVCFT